MISVTHFLICGGDVAYGQIAVEGEEAELTAYHKEFDSAFNQWIEDHKRGNTMIEEYMIPMLKAEREATEERMVQEQIAETEERLLWEMAARYGAVIERDG